jgi:hypothetical protein
VDIERVKGRIRKLLATAADDAATEGEIDNAVRFARQMLAAHHLINDRAIFDSDQILQMLGMTEQPGDTPGTCRYCGCTDNFGCGDCEWVDGDATICSACI